jgi:hypothetical protein
MEVPVQGAQSNCATPLAVVDGQTIHSRVASAALGRTLLTGLERTRIDITFISALLDEATDTYAARTAAATALRRLDDMIAQVADEATGGTSAT